jgi:hypothetical protein
MRRALTGLTAAALTLLALAGPASAAPAQVTQVRFHGTFANGLWVTSSATQFTITLIGVSNAPPGSELFADQFTINEDANGAFTGATDTRVQVTSGFSFSITQPLVSASASGTGLPATTCTYDANIVLIGCSTTTTDLAAAWTGQGPIDRGVTNTHFRLDGFSETTHSNGSARDATATGTFGGSTLSADDLQFADLGTTNSGLVAICIGTSC